jgi:hypothetical protein
MKTCAGDKFAVQGVGVRGERVVSFRPRRLYVRVNCPPARKARGIQDWLSLRAELDAVTRSPASTRKWSKVELFCLPDNILGSFMSFFLSSQFIYNLYKYIE